MDTKVLAELHIEAPVEEVYAFAADLEHFNELKSSPMRGRYQTVEKTPEGVGSTFRAYAHLVGGLYYETTGRVIEAVPNERVAFTTEGRVMETLMMGTFVFRMQPDGSGTRLTVEYTPPTIEKIPVIGGALGSLIDKEMVREHDPVWAELKQVLEAKQAA